MQPFGSSVRSRFGLYGRGISEAPRLDQTSQPGLPQMSLQYSPTSIMSSQFQPRNSATGSLSIIADHTSQHPRAGANRDHQRIVHRYEPTSTANYVTTSMASLSPQGRLGLLLGTTGMSQVQPSGMNMDTIPTNTTELL
ncbi:hypothetical protein HDU76_013592, partial [Blyttiomyces sp. JEL0837]